MAGCGKNFYYVRREQQYRNIKPILMVEALLTEQNGSAVRDYKFFCFHGKVRFILVTGNGGNGSNDYYDRAWNRLDITRSVRTDGALPRPDRLDEMVRVAETLAADFTFVRVDLYGTGQRVFFGELTFVPGGGSGTVPVHRIRGMRGRLWAGAEVDLTRFHDRRVLPADAAAA